MRVPLRTLSMKRKIILALVAVVLVPPLLLAAIISTSIPLARWENPDDLMAVDYQTDHRKRVFGYALDHTFVRGIKIANGTSQTVDTSDHNPMSVTLEF